MNMQSQGFVAIRPSASSDLTSAKSAKGLVASNTKAKQSARTTAKAAKGGKSSSDPLFVSSTWRRRTLRDFNKMSSALTTSKNSGTTALSEACCH